MTCDERLVPLTDEERVILDMLFGGATYRRVGRTLRLSVRTIERRIAGIKRRTGCRTLMEIAARLIREAVVPPAEGSELMAT